MTSCDQLWLALRIGYWLVIGLVAAWLIFRAGVMWERRR